MKKGYLFYLLVAGDQFINALLAGCPDNTISGRAGRGRNEGKRIHTWVADAIDFVFLKLFNDENHCEKSIEVCERDSCVATKYCKGRRTQE